MKLKQVNLFAAIFFSNNSCLAFLNKDTLTHHEFYSSIFIYYVHFGFTLLIGHLLKCLVCIKFPIFYHILKVAAQISTCCLLKAVLSCLSFISLFVILIRSSVMKLFLPILIPDTCAQSKFE